MILPVLRRRQAKSACGLRSEVTGGEEAIEVGERELGDEESRDREIETGKGRQDRCADNGRVERGEREGNEEGGRIEGGEGCAGGEEVCGGGGVIYGRPAPAVTQPEGFFLYTEKRAQERQAFDQQVGSREAHSSDDLALEGYVFWDHKRFTLSVISCDHPFEQLFEPVGHPCLKVAVEFVLGLRCDSAVLGDALFILVPKRCSSGRC